jgi:hypothetical protein
MALINWNKYLPKKFVYNNYSIDEFVDNYSDSMMFSEPINITLVDDEENAFTQHIKYRKLNTLYVSRRRKVLKKIQTERNAYCYEIKTRNKELHAIKKELLLKIYALLNHSFIHFLNVSSNIK